MTDLRNRINCGMINVYKSPDGKYICSVCKKEMENGYIEEVRKLVGEKHADSIDKRAKLWESKHD